LGYQLTAHTKLQYPVLRLNTNILGSVFIALLFPSMLDAASSADMAAAAGSSTSIPPLATDLAAITVAAALPETTTRPPLSVGVDVTPTAVTTAANVANNAC
jgi:hypothetical protein